MKNKRKHFLALSLASIGAIGAFASVSAASLPAGTPKEARDQAHTVIKQAITNGDYQAYLLATKDNKGGVAVLTEAQFNALVAANKLRATGDTAGAQKLLSDAGIKPPMFGNQKEIGKHGDRGVKKNQMATLTDAQKATLKQAEDLFKAGKTAEAQTLLANAGIKMPGEKIHKGGEGKGEQKEKRGKGSSKRGHTTATTTVSTASTTGQ